ncbi:MAG: hypothetical protein ACE5HT_05730 [Gemmatimonadales bacterium]
MKLRGISLLVLVIVAPSTARAQEWNSDLALRVVRRAIERRTAMRSVATLHDYRARAHGFVFFMAQLGEGFPRPPQLVKSDQLELEVYWEAPGRSKQRIIGRRDRRELPTDIQYHRDHLGIVTDNFGSRIGLGQNDEVKDVPHPLSVRGQEKYDYALVDSLTIRFPTQTVRVLELRTRPKDPDEPGVIGTLYIDADGAQVVQFRFKFTRSSYVDKRLEDITVVLENALWDERFWLPQRQEIEIRRRSSVLEMPLRGIIHGIWQIDSYQLNSGIPAATFRGPAIAEAPSAVRDSFEWDRSFGEAVSAAASTGRVDLETVRAEVRSLVARRVLSGLATARPGARSLSDLLHVNRVEGLAIGGGGVVRRDDDLTSIRFWGGYGVSDHRLKGRLAVGARVGGVILGVSASRTVRDVGDTRVIAPVLNSLLAQEVANDYGDYYLSESATAFVKLGTGSRRSAALYLGTERSISVVTRATPATGRFRPNPALGGGTFGKVTLELGARASDYGIGRVRAVNLRLEGGGRAGWGYVRVLGSVTATARIGATSVVLNGTGGWGSRGLPRHRSFVLGGRGTLVSQPFRIWGGRRSVLGTVAWRIGIPFVGVPLGAMATASDEIVVAPFARLGSAGGRLTDPVPWRSSHGARFELGTAVEWFHGLLRAELATSPRDGSFGITLDIRRDLWGIL